MNNKNDIYRNLNEKGRRITRQKMIILDVLFDNTDRMLSANDIHSLVPADINIDIATVYRNLQGFAEDGILETMVDASGLGRYKICDSEPHHHMICTECGRIINFPCAVKFWEPYLDENNFTETSHVIEIYGKCSKCNKIK